MTKKAKKVADEYTRMLPAAYSQGFAHVRILPEPELEPEETFAGAALADEADNAPCIEPVERVCS